jgi:Protein of unknown function (DUF3224)
MAVATSTFTIESWDEDPLVDDGVVRVYRTRLTKRFVGDFEGTSAGDLVMVHVRGQPFAYCGFDRCDGTLAGRTGTFLLRQDAADGKLTLTVVPEAGTGELSSLSGSARIEIDGEVGDQTAPHRLVLDYTL